MRGSGGGGGGRGIMMSRVLMVKSREGLFPLIEAFRGHRHAVVYR